MIACLGASADARRMDAANTFDLRLPVSTVLPEGWLDELAEEALRKLLRDAGRNVGDGPLRLLRRSLDLRGRGEPMWQLRIEERSENDVAHQLWRPNDALAKGAEVIVVGSGPAGTFAALALVEAGLSPIIIDRGEAVQPRRKALADLSARGQLHDDSNYCFGEGGAGTFSDGKLYTRVKDKTGVRKVLEVLRAFGAPQRILVDAHPHVGSNRLPPLLVALRDHLIARGVVYKWGSRVQRLLVKGGTVSGVELAGGEQVQGAAVILATGHSARDIYDHAFQAGVAMVAKPFALGGRIEHPQDLIDSVQYGSWKDRLDVGAAAYSVRCQVGEAGEQQGVYSFCMCPGGHIVPASTQQGRLVLNGMSLSKRASAFANSGLVVTIDEAQLAEWAKAQGLKGPEENPLIGLDFQERIEAAAYRAGGGDFVAPAQRITDLVAGRVSDDLPDCSYQRGLKSADLSQVFPPQVHAALAAALPRFERQIPGYFTRDAVLLAAESRSSAPLRLLRHKESCESLSHKNLYPCGEGAGQAGGIVSAALDGLRVAATIIAAETGAHS
ncbi:MAG: FAD-dependent monooxygenase [Myxococcota bacterium]|nr:FAD-dependent monooxygenase [Myxococcota bacterium]